MKLIRHKSKDLFGVRMGESSIFQMVSETECC